MDRVGEADERIRVVVADDRHPFAVLLVLALDEDNGFEVVDVISDHLVLLRRLIEGDVDLVAVGADGPLDEAIELTTAIRALRCGAAVVVVGDPADDAARARAGAAGVTAIVSSDASMRRILLTLRSAELGVLPYGAAVR